MKKLFLSTAFLLPLALLTPKAFAQNYTYDCLCLYSEPGGTCVEYTCDAYRSNNSRYYQGGYGCNSRYDNNCNSGSLYRPIYRNSMNQYYNSQYYNNPSSQYYDTRYDYDWYYRRYTGRNNNNYYDSSYYNTPYYY